MLTPCYSSPDPFRGKRVLVADIGNSACEVSSASPEPPRFTSHTAEDASPLIHSSPGPTLDSSAKYPLDDAMPRLMGSLRGRRVRTPMFGRFS